MIGVSGGGIVLPLVFGLCWLGTLGLLAATLTAKSISLLEKRDGLRGCYYLVGAIVVIAETLLFRYFSSEVVDNDFVLPLLFTSLGVIVAGLLLTSRRQGALAVVALLVILAASTLRQSTDSWMGVINYSTVVCAYALLLFLLRGRIETFYFCGVGLAGLVPLVWGEILLWLVKFFIRTTQ